MAQQYPCTVCGQLLYDFCQHCQFCFAEDWHTCPCWKNGSVLEQAPVVSQTIYPPLLTLDRAATPEQPYYQPVPTQPAPIQPNNEFGFFPELHGALPDNQVVIPPLMPLNMAAQPMLLAPQQPVPVAQPPMGDNKPQAPPINLTQQQLLRGRGRPKKAAGAPKQPYHRKTGAQGPKHARPGRPKGSKDQAQRRPKGEGKKALREKARAAYEAENEAAAAPAMAPPALPTQGQLPAPSANWDMPMPGNGLQQPVGWGWQPTEELPTLQQPLAETGQLWDGTENLQPAPLTEEEINSLWEADFRRLFTEGNNGF